MHDVLIVGVPLVAILAGTFFKNQGMGRLEAHLDKTDSPIDRIQTQLLQCAASFSGGFEQFYRTLGQHDPRIDNLEKRQ